MNENIAWEILNKKGSYDFSRRLHHCTESLITQPCDGNVVG